MATTVCVPKPEANVGARLPAATCTSRLSTIFTVTEAEAATIRATFDQHGELSAVIELRRLFPGVTDHAPARACVRTIAGWKPPPVVGTA